MPNKITPVNPALASRFHSLPFVGRVTEFRRSAMKKILTLLSLCALVAFRTASLAEQPKDQLTLSKKEKAEITAAVKKETDEPIHSIRRESPDTAKVWTGKVTPGRLEGGGTIFTLKRTKKGWELQKLTGKWSS